SEISRLARRSSNRTERVAKLPKRPERKRFCAVDHVGSVGPNDVPVGVCAHCRMRHPQIPTVPREHMRQKRAFIRGVLLWAAAAPVACGGDSSTGPKANALTPAEAQQVAMAIFTEVSKALASVGATAPTAASRSVAAGPTQTFSSPCTNGGTISGSFTFTSTLDSQGAGTVNGSETMTPSGWKGFTGTPHLAVGGSRHVA